MEAFLTFPKAIVVQVVNTTLVGGPTVRTCLVATAFICFSHCWNIANAIIEINPPINDLYLSNITMAGFVSRSGGGGLGEPAVRAPDMKSGGPGFKFRLDHACKQPAGLPPASWDF